MAALFDRQAPVLTVRICQNQLEELSVRAALKATRHEVALGRQLHAQARLELSQSTDTVFRCKVLGRGILGLLEHAALVQLRTQLLDHVAEQVRPAQRGVVRLRMVGGVAHRLDETADTLQGEKEFLDTGIVRMLDTRFRPAQAAAFRHTFVRVRLDELDELLLD